MKLHILIGQRKQRYEGQYGLEALACMTEYDQDANEDYLPEQVKRHEESREFDALRMVTLDVSEKAIRAVLFPENTPIPAVVSNAEDQRRRSRPLHPVVGRHGTEDEA